ncbi:MAG: PEP-CTERM sorting domain-containing protein [Verrucomicrobiota bacterium]
MKTNPITTLTATFAALLIAVLALPGISRAATIYTYDGNGADAKIVQTSNDGSTTLGNMDANFGADERIGARTWDDGDGDTQRYEAVLLRFDISGYNSGSFTDDSTLGLTLHRDNDVSMDLFVYGLNDGLDDWVEGNKTGENGEDDELTYNNAPGIEQDEVAGDSDLDHDSSETTDLLATFKNFTGDEGEEITVASSDITTFLNADSDGLVTFLILREHSTGTGQFHDFASKETTSLEGGSITGDAGDFAPSLTFDGTVIPEPTTLALLLFGGAALLRRPRQRR